MADPPPARTPLPEIDHAATAAFWSRAGSACGLSGSVPPVHAFGDSVELADELIHLVLHGPKRATASLVLEYVDEPVPAVGDLWIATDGARRPRVLLESTDVRIGPLSSVDDSFAWDEGEGDRTRASWLADHTAYFTRTLAFDGIEFDPDLPTVFERFTVRYQED